MNIKSLLINKQIILALGMIVFVGAALTYGTGAFFSDSASATGNVFQAGTLALKIAKDNAGTAVNGWLDEQSAAWNFTDMVPGGTPVEDAVWLKNVGSVDGQTLGVAMANANATVPNTAKQMRITKMTLGGVSLLEGGAGADFSDYATPTNCDVNVTPGTFASSVTSATAGQVICIGAGAYNPGDLTVSADNVTIVALNAPDTANKATVDGTFNVTGDGVTIKGLAIEPGTVASQGSAININANDVTIDSNIISNVDGLANGGSVKGIYVGHTGTLGTRSDVTVTNNLISGVDALTTDSALGGRGAYGILVNFGGDTTGLTVSGNTITDLEGLWAHAIGLEGDTPNASVTLNDISGIIDHKSPTDTDSVGVMVENNNGVASIVINSNNFAPDVLLGIRNEEGTTVNGQNNWWGDLDPSDNISGPVNTFGHTGSPIAGLINGADFNGNGFADLQDLNNSPIVNAGVGLDGGEEKLFEMAVQLDGPTTGNEFQGASITTDFVFTLNQQ
jgi:predicted ribosomally synthesized peptide with SipW-like signal peptide